MIIAPLDRLASGQLATAVYDSALEPKKIVLVAGGHFDAYSGDGFARSSGAARDWFVEHLTAK
jgi:uncharacterized protein